MLFFPGKTPTNGKKESFLLTRSDYNRYFLLSPVDTMVGRHWAA
jgi:hypothetical protein